MLKRFLGRYFQELSRIETLFPHSFRINILVLALLSAAVGIESQKRDQGKFESSLRAELKEITARSSMRTASVEQMAIRISCKQN